MEIEQMNKYLDEKYNKKKYKNCAFIHASIDSVENLIRKMYWFSEKANKLLEQEKKENKPKYFSSLYIEGRFCTIDKTIDFSDDLEGLFNKSIQWLDGHFIS